MNLKNRGLFILNLLILLGGRLWVAGTGYLEDQDELLYQWIHMHFGEFAHFSTWVDALFHMQGQPPEIFIRLLEYISILPISSLLGKQMLHPDVLYFIGLYNILVSMLILFVFYKILLKLEFPQTTSILGSFLLGTLLNYTIYTRHIIPYDHAILFHLLSLNILVDENPKKSRYFFAGFLSVLGFTIYMGSFMFSFINGLVLVVNQFRYGEWKRTFQNSLLFIIPFFLVVFFYEGTCRLYGKSYWGFISDYSQTVYMASPDEGYSYIFKYFFQVEKWWGTTLLFLFIIGSIQSIITLKLTNKSLLIWVGILSYLLYGSMVYFSAKVVFHGRILHVFIPFVIIGVIYLLNEIKFAEKWNFHWLIGGIALLNYLFMLQDFNQIGYPRNAFYKYQLFEKKDKIRLTYYNEMATPVIYSNRKEWLIDSTGNSNLPEGNYRAYNLCFNIHYPDSAIKSFPPQFKDEQMVLYSQLHFQSHPAYAFEYCARDGRNLFINKKLQIKVVRLKEL